MSEFEKISKLEDEVIQIDNEIVRLIDKKEKNQNEIILLNCKILQKRDLYIKQENLKCGIN